MLTVREATSDDLEAIVAVNAAGWRQGYRGIVSEERLADLPVKRWRSEIRNGLREPAGDSFTRVAELDGKFAGYCFVAAPARDEDLDRSAELVALYVEPDRWGEGIGSALIEVAEREAASRGYQGYGPVDLRGERARARLLPTTRLERRREPPGSSARRGDGGPSSQAPR